MASSFDRYHRSPPSALEARVAELERELEAALAREREWMRRQRDLEDFVDNAVVGLHQVGPDGTILWANHADWELVGCTRDEYVGHNVSEFHANADALCKILGTLSSGGVLREQPATLRCKDGSLRQVLISSNAHMEDGRFINTRCFTRDVTEQFVAEAARDEARTHLAALVESSDDAIISLDLDEDVHTWNRGAEKTYGFGREEMAGKSILSIVPPELHAEEEVILDKVRRGGRVDHYETVRLKKNGERVDISLTVSPIHDASGRVIGISKVARDITQRKLLQRKLADEARRKDEFLAILAHELRNPLAPIRYALGVAKQPNHTPEQRDRADAVIYRQVEQMARLLDDLLDVSRIARGHVELRKESMSLRAAIDGAIDAARPLIEEKGHVLEVDLQAGPLQIHADPVRITQIVSNLLTNAAKYTDVRGHIVLQAWREGANYKIAVSDNGIGIDPAMMPRLFTLFSQAEPALTRAQGGLGIGLALVKGFVEMHDGSVEAHSAGQGHGSEFIVTLPAD